MDTSSDFAPTPTPAIKGEGRKTFCLSKVILGRYTKKLPVSVPG